MRQGISKGATELISCCPSTAEGFNPQSSLFLWGVILGKNLLVICKLEIASRLGMGAHVLFPFSFRIWSGGGLHGSCVCHPSLCEFTHALVLLIEKTLFLWYSPSVRAPTLFPLPLLQGSLSYKGWFDGDVLFLWLRDQGLSLCVKSGGGSLCLRLPFAGGSFSDDGWANIWRWSASLTWVRKLILKLTIIGANIDGW